MSSSWTASAPGKLMIAGEYSVLNPGGSALAFAVEPSLKVALRPSTSNLLTSEALGLVDAPVLPEGPTRFVWHALQECARHTSFDGAWHVTVGGGLPVDGEKVGFGTSAAVVSGVVAACLGALESRELGVQGAFGVAAEAHCRAQGRRGSGYDVATAMMGGVVYYRPSSPVSELHLESLAWPEGLLWTAGFSGKGAHTPSLIGNAAGRAPSLLESMRAASSELVTSWKDGNARTILPLLGVLDERLEAWSDAADLSLFPPSLSRLRELALEAGVVPRVSGAGGGDTLLAFSDDLEALQRVETLWREEGFRVLCPTLTNTGAWESAG